MRRATILVLGLNALASASAQACDEEATALAREWRSERPVRLDQIGADFIDLCVAGEILFQEGSLDEAAEAFDRAVAASLDDLQRSDALRRQGYALLEMGELLAARRLFEDSLRAANNSGDTRDLFQVLSGLAGVRHALGDTAGTLDLLTEALDAGSTLHAQFSDDATRVEVAKLHYNTIRALIDAGRIEAARRTWEAVDRYLSPDDDPFFLAFRDMLDGEIALLEGDVERARVTLEGSLALIDDAPSPAFRFSMLARVADVHEARDDGHGMLRITRRMYADLEEMAPPSPRLLRLTHLYEGRARHLIGDDAEASRAFEAAYQAAETFYAETNAQEMARLEARYDKTERDAEIGMLRAENEAKAAAVSRQRLVMGSSSAIVVLAGLSAFLLLQRQRERQRHAAMIARHEAVFGERSRIAREVHDTLLQGLFSISLHAQRAAKRVDDPPVVADALETIRSLVEQTSASGRQAILRYRDENRDQQVEVDIETVVREAAGSESVQIVCSHVESVFISESVLLDLLAIIREAVMNAVRHGKPPVRITARGDAGMLTVSVTDSGTGMPNTPAPAGRYGVQGMMERAERSNLSLQFSEHGRSEVTVTAEYSKRQSRVGHSDALC